jgi:cell division protein FtsW
MEKSKRNSKNNRKNTETEVGESKTASKDKTGFKNKRVYMDGTISRILIAMTFLIAIGLVMIFSASKYDVAASNFLKQVFGIVLGLFAMIVAIKIPYHWWEKLAVIALIISGVLMVLLMIPSLSVTAGGATRWVRLPFLPVNIQVSDVVKVAIILCVALYIKRYWKKMGDWKKKQGWGYVLVLWIGVGVIAGVLFIISNNLSSLLIIMAIAFGTTFICSKNWQLHVIVLGVAIVFAIGYLFVVTRNTPDADTLRVIIENNEGSFRDNRIYGWLFTEKYADSAGYQVIQALYAVGSGGLLGKGLGNGTQKLSAIPEAQNDMIFAIVCEELGIVGAVLVLLLYGYLIYQLTIIVRECTNVMGCAMVIGVIVHITCQVLINVGVATNLIPNTGVGLPFISYGGTAVLMLMVEIGMCISVRVNQINRPNYRAKVSS